MKGTYVLIMCLPRDLKIGIGSLGKIKFNEGGYAYVGSGLNSLEKRIERHLDDEKKLYWHIDYFLEEAKVKEVLFGESPNRKECEIAQKLREDFSTVENFGSSDCDCESHLFYSVDLKKLKRRTASILREVDLNPQVW